MPRQQIAEARRPRPIHGGTQIRAELMRSPFSGFQRDIARKSFGDDHINNPLPYVVTFDETMIVEMLKFAFAQNPAGLPHLLKSFNFLYSDIEQTDRRADRCRKARAPSHCP